MRECAIAGTYAEFMEWRRQRPDRHVSYLTKDRAEQLLARGAEKGVLHRIGSWEESPALEIAVKLELD